MINAIKALEIDPDYRFGAKSSQADYVFSDYIGESHIVLDMLEQCQRISKTDHPILIIGETGVGKEIIASAIFNEYRNNKDIPFIKINCAAIPNNLLESELFGYEKGAFTGANIARKGKFELADTGAILLDEIGEMDISLQSKLLRVLESKEFERVGGNKSYPLNARIIASTNQNLKQLVAAGKFRMDLYFRLNALEVNIPPLRKHKADIPKLIDHFKHHDNLTVELTSSALSALLDYDWPGNVRELKNVLSRLHFLHPNTVIDASHIFEIIGELADLLYNKNSAELAIKKDALQTVSAPLAEIEKQAILNALKSCDYNVSEAARSLGISRSAIYQKMNRYQINIKNNF